MKQNNSNFVLLGNYITECDDRNESLAYGEDSVRGLSTGKIMTATKANLEGVSLASYKIVKPEQFAFVPDTSRRGEKISLGKNDTSEECLVSSISCVFKIKDKTTLLSG